MKRAVLTAVSLLILFAVPAKATTYYVSKSGSDANSCATATSTALSNQKLTISAGVACATAPGDFVYIHGGIYTGSLNVIDSQTYPVASGAPGNVITIGGYAGETVTIQPPNNVSGIRLTTGAKSYLVFQDLIIDLANSVNGTDADNIFLDTARHNRLQRLEVKNGKAFGIHFSDTAGSNEVLNCLVHDTGYTAGGQTNGHAMYITSGDNLIEGNDLYNNGGYGLHFYNTSGSTVSRNILRNNKIHNNGRNGGTTYGIVINRGQDNIIYNNLIYDNAGGGVLVYTSSVNTGIYNNTIYNNTLEGVRLEFYGSAPVVENNILYNNASTIVNAGGTGTPVLSNNLTTNPLFVNAGAFDFQLQPGSAAINAGAALSSVPVDFVGTSRPQGGAYDIGAYEYSLSGGGSGTGPAPPANFRLLSP